MNPPLYQVDAFADGPFTGNPAAVCLLDRERPPSWMQSVAREMNLSETAFVTGTEGILGLRWFTPEAEVDLCGHATLASAHVLWETERADAERTLSFATRSGILTAHRRDQAIELDFPSRPPHPIKAPSGLLESLGVNAVAVEASLHNTLVEVATEAELRDVRPDFRALRGGGWSVILTSPSDNDRFDFVSRYFAPGFRVEEDPVTGSAHCVLGPYWERRLGREEFVAYQASARGGVVGVRVSGERTLLRGRAVTVLTGELSAAALEVPRAAETRF